MKIKHIFSTYVGEVENLIIVTKKTFVVTTADKAVFKKNLNQKQLSITSPCKHEKQIHESLPSSSVWYLVVTGDCNSRYSCDCITSTIV